MFRRSVACGTLALIAVAIAKAEDSSAWQSGRTAFAEGKKLVDEGKDGREAFQRAMKAFEKSDVEGISCQARVQGIGNAAFLADDLPRAILAFRYGLFCDRNHALLRENLAYARSQVRYMAAGQRGRPEVDPWPIWLPRVGGLGCSSIALISYFAACVTLTIALQKRKAKFFVVGVVFVLVALAAGYGWNLLRSQADRDVELPLVVLKYDDVPLHTGNGTSYPRHADLPMLMRGMEARRLAARGGWLQIQFASGEIGWISAGAALTWEDLTFTAKVVRGG